MQQIEFPKITIDYDIEIGDIVDIIRGTMSWRITFIRTETTLNASIVRIDGATHDIIDVTDIKDDPLVIQLTIARVLVGIIYVDYPPELQAVIIAGPKSAHMIQKTFEVIITQPIMNAELVYIDPWWYGKIYQDGVLLYTIKRHKDTPDIFHIILPNTDIGMTVYLDSGVMKLARPSVLCSNPDVLIDLTITPTIEEGQ